MHLILFILFVLIQINGYSQSEKYSEAIISLAEELAGDEDDPEAVSSFIERFNELIENPVTINSSSESEISRLFFLSDFQVKAIIDYVHSSGKIVSVYELANIPGFDKETADMMIPFIVLENDSKLNAGSSKWRNTSLTNFSYRSGNDYSDSNGSPVKILEKYKFSATGISGGITAEKDPGERLFSGKPPLPDFLSAHLEYSGNGFLRKFIIGDYSGRFGLGTNINSGTRTSLSLSSPGYMSSRNEIKAYTSTDENRFFRGMAAEFSYKNMELSVFYSKNVSDATLSASSDTLQNNIESLYSSGLHDTPSMILKKDNFSDISFGINFTYNLKNIRLGMIWSEDWLSVPVNSTENGAEDVFKFNGDRNTLYSTYYNAFFKRILLFGEISIDRNKRYTMIQGISLRPSDRLTINIKYRNIKPGFMSLHGNNFVSNLTASGENNISGSFNFEAAKKLFISGGCEFREYQWLKYRCSAPTEKIRKELRLKYLPSETLSLDLTYSYNYSMVDNTESEGIPLQKQLVTRSIKNSIRYAVNENLKLTTRADFKVSDPSGSRGMVLLQDLNYNFRTIPFTIWVRYSIFRTDSWDSRIYVYENDLLYSFNIPALSGVGSRSYILVKYDLRRNAELRLKYGFTSFTGTDPASSDKEDVKVQFRIRF